MDTAVWPVLLLYLLVLTEDGKCFQNDFSEPIVCRFSSNTRVDLSFKHLTAVPRDLPRNTQFLDLSHNKITQLWNNDLGGLPDLCELKITHNALSDISPSAFQNSSRVRILNVSSNALRTIPEFSLPDLRVLDLSDNHYESYSLGESYSGLLNLIYLSLGSPLATSLKQADLTPLHAIPLFGLKLGCGAEMSQYEVGSLAQLTVLQEMTLQMTFCQNPGLFENILQDLDKTNVKSLTLIKLFPDICNVSSNLTEGLRGMRHLSNLTFCDTWFNSSVLTKTLFNVIQSPIKTLLFFNITFAQDTVEGVQIKNIPGYNESAKLEVIVFETVHHYQYNFPLISINESFFSRLNYVKFSSTGMSITPCGILSPLPSLQVLDFSDNLLNEGGLWWAGCSFANVFVGLKRLYVKNNKFKDLQFIANHTNQMKNLSVLDLSTNSIMLMGKSMWAPHLTELSLSDNSLGDPVFGYLSPYMEKVNLSHTGITALSQDVLSKLPGLRMLFLSSNIISSLPLDLSLPHLEELHIDQNNINTLQQRSFDGLCGLKRLKAGKNPFVCNCDMYWFVTSYNKTVLIDWPSDYICSSPASLAGTMLENYHPGWVACSPWTQAGIALLITGCVGAVLAFAFYALDGAWYLHMLWVWIRMKRRSQKKSDRLQAAIFKYHAFISYSQKDSQWVDTQLVPNLEAAQFSLCVHERDFVPGEWIIDNIINCVEGSYKTLFVLSQNFVRSEWCNYELFFAQHRDMSIQRDSLVFILLEPIPADSLPKKFLKLRTLLRQQTYLEWHKDEYKQQVFWASLRAMLQTGESSMVMERIAKEMTDLCHLLPSE